MVFVRLRSLRDEKYKWNNKAHAYVAKIMQTARSRSRADVQEIVDISDTNHNTQLLEIYAMQDVARI